MKTKELLCIALIADNGDRYDAEIYKDGTFKNKKGEIQKLSPLQFENVKVLHRRSEREKMLIVAANDVVPYRDGDKEPEKYVENLAPLTEEDFLLPEERRLPLDMVTADAVAPAEQFEAGKAEAAKDEPAASIEPIEDASESEVAKDKKRKKKDKKEKEREKTQQGAADNDEPQPEDEPSAEPKKKKKAPVLLVILLLLLLCGAGFGIGYMNGYFDLNMLPGIVSEEPGGVSSETPAATATPEPVATPTPVPPKTEINLTINAMDGAEVSGSTDVGVNEDTEGEPEATPAGTETPESNENP